MTENEQPTQQPAQAEDWSSAAEVAQAGAELASAAIQPVAFGQLGQGVESGDSQNLDLLLDVEIPISVEVGRAQMSLQEVLKLVPGSVIGLDKKAEEPVDLRVNGKLVARGEVVLVDDVYGLRVTQIVDAAGRIESLR
ncbi:MAG: flagellar motor switch protein FliN [Planctomycetes bacterium]|nr:flagellar motor switch protein FliN [Planctomycetota bacterium]